MTNERIRCINMGDSRGRHVSGARQAGRIISSVTKAAAATGLALAGLVAAEPVKFDWRYHAGQDDSLSTRTNTNPLPDKAPNPIVLPTPQPEPETEESATGWHWISPKIAGSPGTEADREAVRLADREQEAAMAEKHSPLNSVLPGSLSGVAPMAVETGIEYRF